MATPMADVTSGVNYTSTLTLDHASAWLIFSSGIPMNKGNDSLYAAEPTSQVSTGHELPLISILVPVYNVAPYLRESLQSIAIQSYKHFEVIVVDDCSTDGTWDLAQAFALQDPRFVVYRNEKNMRIAETLNRALSYARGEFIGRCDGDDIMEPDRLERQYGYLLARPEIALVGCSFKTINERGDALRDVVYPSGNDLIKKLLPFQSPVSHIWLARREVYAALGGYRLSSVEDYDFLLRASSRGYGLDNIPEYSGMKIRLRSGNTISRYGVVQRRLFNYAKKLNRFETFGDGGAEKYSRQLEVDLVQRFSMGNLARLHYCSDIISSRAARSRYGHLRYGGHLLSGLISPLKMQLYLRILMCSIVKKLHRSD